MGIGAGRCVLDIHNETHIDFFTFLKALTAGMVVASSTPPSSIGQGVWGRYLSFLCSCGPQLVVKRFGGRNKVLMVQRCEFHFAAALGCAIHEFIRGKRSIYSTRLHRPVSLRLDVRQ